MVHPALPDRSLPGPGPDPGVQLRTLSDIRQADRRLSTDWSTFVAELIESNAQLRHEIEILQAQMAEFEDTEGGG